MKVYTHIGGRAKIGIALNGPIRGEEDHSSTIVHDEEEWHDKRKRNTRREQTRMIKVGQINV